MPSLEAKVDALMRLALSDTVEEQEKAIAVIRGLQELSATPADIDSIIRATLLELGVPDGLRGHRYLVTAIRLAVENPATLEDMTNTLYSAVAREYDVHWRRGERMMRNAIEVAFDRVDPEVIAAYWGNTISPTKGKPTTREFIARVANDVRPKVTAHV